MVSTGNLKPCGFQKRKKKIINIEVILVLFIRALNEAREQKIKRLLQKRDMHEFSLVISFES